MSEKTYEIRLTTKELIKYYANKIVVDGLTETYAFSCCKYFNEYEHQEFIENYKEEILKCIKRDERVADVHIEDDCYDMIFFLDYCPYYYDEVENNLSRNDEIKLFEKFKRFLLEQKKDTLKEDFYTSTRELINDFFDKFRFENQDITYNRIKQVISESMFNEKYIDKYEVLVDANNINELVKILNRKINELIEQDEVEKSDE